MECNTCPGTRRGKRRRRSRGRVKGENDGQNVYIARAIHGGRVCRARWTVDSGDSWRSWPNSRGLWIKQRNQTAAEGAERGTKRVGIASRTRDQFILVPAAYAVYAVGTDGAQRRAQTTVRLGRNSSLLHGRLDGGGFNGNRPGGMRYKKPQSYNKNHEITGGRLYPPHPLIRVR